MELNDFLTLIRFKNITIAVFYILIFSTLITRSFVASDFALILISNLLAIWEIYSFNDLEDAKVEMILKKRGKVFHKNLIINGKITQKEAFIITLILAISALLIAMTIANSNFVLVILILTIGFLYSEKHFRLKSKPPLDVLSHAFIGPLIPLSIFINTRINSITILALFSFFLGSLIPEILNQRYDYKIDKKNKIKTTVQILGKGFSLKLIILMSVTIILLNGGIFFLYGSKNLALLYLSLVPFLIMFLFKKVRQLLEKRPVILVIPLGINIFILLLGFLNIV